MPFLAAVPVSDHELLQVLVADRRHDATGRCELRRKRRIDLRRRGGDEDAVVRRLRSVTERRVVIDDAHVPVSQACEQIARGSRERDVALDRDDICGELAEDGGLIAGAGADLEYAIRDAKVEQLGHARDDVGLRDGLSLADRERVVAVRDGTILGADELLPRDVGHRVEDAGVMDAKSPQLLEHAAARVVDPHAHMMRFFRLSPVRWVRRSSCPTPSTARGNVPCVAGTPVAIVRSVLDFEQLAFIEKWRQKATRGVVVALDGTRGDIVVTLRVGEGDARLDLRGRDATGAARKMRLAIGDRVTMAIEFMAKDVTKGSGRGRVNGGVVGAGATIEGVVKEMGEIAMIDCGADVLVRGESLGSVNEGDPVAFTVAADGKAYLIPTRG